MAEFKLGRLRFVWQGEWTTQTQYVKDDIVRYGGGSYVCVKAHTSDNTDFYVDFDAPNDSWELMTSGLQWRTSPWTSGTYYAEGDIVRNGGKVYVCVDGHTAAPDFYTDFDAPNSNWQLFVDGTQWKTDPWTASGTLYKEGDLVRHGGRVYICVDGHTSSAGFEADFNATKWQLFADGTQWVNTWTASQLYKVGDIVRVSGKTYICVNEHTANGVQRGGFYSDTANWNLYADGNQHRGPWDTAEYYWVGDFVRYGAKNYICMLGHEADADFYADFDTNKWQLLTDGQQWVSSWTADSWYKEGDIVKHGGTTYICINGHTSTDAVDETGFDVDLAANQWEVFSTGYNWKNEWTADTYYKVSDIVRYGAKAYVCVTAHTSAAGFDTDWDATGIWQLLVDGQQWKTAAWTESALYKEGDLVRYGGRVYICVNGHTATSITNRFDTDFDDGKWQLFNDGSQWKTSPWTASAYYKTGDIVKYGGKTYIALNDHQANSTQSGGFYTDLTANEWNLYADGTEWLGDWTISHYYRLGDIVRYDGNVYVCQIPHTSAATIEEGLEYDLNIDPELTKWSTYSEGFKFKGEWATTTKYNVNDVVKFGGSIYICVAYHSSVSNFEELYWNVLVGGLQFEDTWSAAVEYQIGDIVTYGGYSYVAQTRNTAKIPPGFSSDWDLLTTGFKVTGEWSPSRSYKVGELVKYGGSSYVAVVETGPGQTPTTPEGGVSILWEVVAPGFKWRGTWAGANDYRIGDTIRWVANTYTCILDHTSVEGGPDQPDNDTLGTYWESIAEGAEGNVLTRRGDLVTRDAIQNKRLPRGVEGQVLQVQGKDLKWDYFNIVDNVYYVTTDGIDSPERGTTLQTPFRTVQYATQYILEDEATRSPATIYVKTGTYAEELPIIVPANVAIVGDELRSTRIQPAVGRGVDTVAVVASGSGYVTAPLVEFSEPTIAGGVKAEGLALLGTGAESGKVVEIVITKAGSGYASTPIVTLTGGDFVSSAAATATLKTKLYSQTNMFYLRDATGLRNMTLLNLDVPLGEPNQYLTRRPSTDCYYVSLDPGTGPGDESVWVTTRSPYVQNVTTYGSGAVGMKVDGAIHNGGYKTMVCNDYTQVISDGIGIWCTNQGRVEAVSVFTYYSHLGYLSEDGGVIRGTNGNCSYGTFGVASEGVDPSEISRISRVNNRKEEAAIINTLVDGDGIVHLEYSNAGENYEPGNTTFTFEGNGVFGTIDVDTVVVQDGGVKEVRVMAAGKDWLAVVNNAQDGNEYSIRLSASDVQVTNAYKGERSVIIDGVGVGQYGYVTFFNGGTKIATIAKESFKPLTVTAASASEFTVASTATLVPNQPITFSVSGQNEVFGNVDEGVVYYVKTINGNGTQFSISDVSGGTVRSLTPGTGTMELHAAGWESYYGQPSEPILDTTTRYTIEPRVVFSTGEGATATGEISKGVDTISRSANGGYFQTAPTVVISGTEADATGATATTTITGTVESVRIRESGSGFTGQPSVTFIGGGLADGSIDHASGQAVITGRITTVAVTDGGAGYTNPPLVTITGSGYAGDGYVSAKITKIVGEINVSNGGGGYTTVPTVSISGGGGSGAEAIANLDAQVTGFTIVEGGSGYTTITTSVQVIPAAGDSVGQGASATFEIDNGTIGGPGVITGVFLDEPGAGYTKPPLVVITSSGIGTGAEVTALITGSISSVTVVKGGANYSSNPSVAFSSGSAVAAATITGSVSQLSIINGGSGFDSTASLSFTPVTDFVYSEATCSRDVGLLVEAVTADMVLNTNVQSVIAGLAYRRSYTSVVLDTQKTQTIAAINYVRDLTLAETANSTARNRITDKFSVITSIINDGVAPSLVYTSPANTTAEVIGAAEEIRANRGFIQAEIIAWIDDQVAANVSNPTSIWFGFTYDSAVCSRDMGLLVDSLAYDLLYGGNVLSTEFGRAYYEGTNGVITAQRDQMLAALDYLYSFIDDVILEGTGWTPAQNVVPQATAGTPGDASTVTTAQGLMTLVSDIVTDGSPLTASSFPTWANGDVNNTIRTTINGAIPTIQTATINWINRRYVGAGAVAVATVSKVVDSITVTSPGVGYTSIPTISITGGNGSGALATVILNGTVTGATVTAPGKNYTTTPTVAFAGGGNLKSIVAGQAYYKNASAAIAISNLQITETLAALEYITDLALSISTNTAPQFAYQAVLSRTGTATAPAGAYDQLVFWVDVVKAMAQNGASNSVAAALIYSNRAFVLEQMSAYATANLTGYTDADLRKRTGLIIDAIYYDLTNGTVERTVAIGQQYGYVCASSQADSLEALTYIEGVLQDIIANVAVVENQVIENQVFAELSASEVTSPAAVKNVINLISSAVNLEGILGDTGNNTFTDLLIDNTSWIQAEIIEYIKSNYVYFTYDQEKCARDTGLIVDAIGMDTALGTNYNSVTAGLAYQRANAGKVKSKQIAKTIAAIEFAKTQTLNLTAYAGNATATSRATAGFDEIVDILRYGTDNANALTFPTPTGADQDLIDAKDQLQSNRTFLRAEITAWIAVNYPALAYDEVKCSRDVGLIVDALSYDILYGGNSATRVAAQSYFVGVTSQLGAGEATATAAAYQHLQSVSAQVVRGTIVTKSAGNTETQDTSSGNTTMLVATDLGNLIQVIIDVITMGNLTGMPSEVLPSTSWVDSELVAARVALNSARTGIVTATINSITTSGFDYNEQLCARDIGLIVDAIAHDVRYAQDALPVATASTTNVLSNIIVDTEGEGYGSGTTITFGGDVGNGDIPVATPIININGAITGFDITTPGKGFIAPPSVTVVADTGSGAYARAYVLGALVQQIRIIHPGSGYNAPPFVKLVDPNNSIEGRFEVRIGNGVLDQPIFLTRGTAYLAAATTVSSPTGYADTYQVGEFVYVQDLTNIPTPGANIQFEGNTQFYKLVTVRDLQGASGITGGRNLITANKEFVKRQIVAWINNTYPELEYNEVLAARDTGLIIDAVIADIFGDTERGIEAGKAYYRNASGIATITGTLGTAAKAAIAQINNYLADIVQNIDIPRNQLFELQVKEPGITNGNVVIPAVQNTIDIILDIVNNGNTIYAVQDLLLDNKAYIQAEVMAFIATTYPDFVFNTALCRRDVGLIVDALAYDLFAGFGENGTPPLSGLARSREAGLRYYSNASALIAIGPDQLTETIAAIEHIGVVALAVVQNINPAIVYQTSVERIIRSSSVTPTLTGRISDGVAEIVNIIENGVDVLPSGTYSARLQVSPPFTVDNVPVHDASVTIRSKYSQVRLTNHDFLNVGTGNKAETNYPGVPVNAPDSANEVLEQGGGRCFYTSTDQDGNFRVGELFAVEQATGIATLNADAFNLSGLNELSLGGINIGGTGATITEFSTDSLFFANSDSVVPTQKAIKTYIASQLGGGGGNLSVNAITAGDVQITGTEVSTNAGVLNVIVPDGVLITETVASTSPTTGSLVVDGGVGIADNVNIGGSVDIGTDLVVQGNLTVNGTSTTLNVGSLSVTDVNVVLAKGAATPLAAFGAGLTVEGPITPASFTYDNTDDSWNSNKVVKAASVEGTPVGSITKSTGAFTTLTSNDDVTFTAGTISSGTSTGTVVVTGGVGISGDLNVGGTLGVVGLSITGGTTLSPNNASVQVNPSGTGGVVISPTGSGGLTINPTAVGTINNTSIGASVRSTGAFTTVAANGVVTITNATASTGVDSGALQVDGGVGINGAVYAGSIQNTPIGSSTASTGAFTTLGASSTVTLSPASANVAISPTGTGTVTISPVGALTINPTAASSINNTSIGASTRSSGAFTTLASNGAVTMTGSTTSTSSTTGQLVVTGGVGVSENLNVGGAVVITGNLTVNGTTTTINSTVVTVDDIVVELGDVASPTDTTANGGGIILKGSTNKTLTWVQSTGYWTFNQGVQAGSIQNTPVGSTTANTGAFTSLTANAAVTFTANTASTTTGTGTVVVTGGLGVSGQVTATTFSGNHSGGTGSFTTLGASSTVTLSPANASVTVSPTGTGTVTIAPATAGTINNVSIGATTRAAGAFTTLSANSTFSLTDTTDSSTTGTGAFVVSGGVGIAKNVNVGGNFGLAGIQTVTPATPLGSVLGNRTDFLNLRGVPGANSNVFDVFMFRDAAGSDWTTAGTRFQQKIDSTFMGWMQFNGSGNGSGISWGTGGTTASAQAVAERMRLDSAGSLRIVSGIAASSTTTGSLIVTGGVGVSGTLYAGALSATTITETSSIALKENVNPITDALDAVMQLVGVTYNRKDTNKYEAGLIAEEVDKVIPELVTKDENGDPYGIQYTKLTAYLIEAVKSLKAEIDALKGSK